MLEKNPKTRISALDALNSEYFKSSLNNNDMVMEI